MINKTCIILATKSLSGTRSFQLFIQTYISPMSLITNFAAWSAIQTAGYELMGDSFDHLFDQVVLAGQVAPTVQILNTLVINVNAVIDSPTQIKILVNEAIKRIEALLGNQPYTG